jgi:hypothetical protein
MAPAPAEVVTTATHSAATTRTAHPVPTAKISAPRAVTNRRGDTRHPPRTGIRTTGDAARRLLSEGRSSRVMLVEATTTRDHGSAPSAGRATQGVLRTTRTTRATMTSQPKAEEAHGSAPSARRATRAETPPTTGTTTWHPPAREKPKLRG